MERKTFMYLSVVGAVGISIPSLSCHNRNEAVYKSISQPTFLSHICDAETLREIGKEYKEQFSPGSGKDQLRHLILADSTGKPLQSSNLSLVSSLVDEKIKQDFETGKTVVVKGWILSVTEARQCALFSLV